MISYADALALLVADAPRLASERVDIDHAQQRLLATDLVSPLSLPGFDNAAMDGYALRAPGEYITAGSTYAVSAMHAAGDCADAYPGAEACEIATGARMPVGFDTVVPVERSERDDERVRFVTDEPRGQNVRRQAAISKRGPLR